MNSRADADWAAERIAAGLVGAQLQHVERREHDWLFSFSGEMQLQPTCPWRIVKDEQLAFGDCDDRQQFGLPAPIDGAAVTRELHGRTIREVRIRHDTGDLTIIFDGTVLLEILNNSSGYEGWQIFHKPYGNSLQIVAMGGGELAVWLGDQSKRARVH